jgi:3-deoxy-D-manno-octulosonic-acid transferase
MTGFLYQFLIRCLGISIRVAALFSPKARQWLSGRKDRFAFMIQQRADAPGPLVWFHCASLGEFEQGRPVIEAFRREHPGHRILLTFFSPSGYEVRKNYPGADHVHYLPLDTKDNARRFLDTWKPQLAIFVKYEYWFNYIRALEARKIPAVVVSAIFRPGQYFFRWYGGWSRRQLSKISWFFVQNRESMELLTGIGIRHASVSGDTRFDRVALISQRPQAFPQLQWLSGERPVMVAGSTWPDDEDLLLHLFRRSGFGMHLVIAPHEITGAGIERLLREFGPETVRFSALAGSAQTGSDGFSAPEGSASEGPDGSSAPEGSASEGPDGSGRGRIVIMDRIGLLSQLYQYATLAYVGGGFGKGIHNILEAATFGVPVFFGPTYQRFAEAVDLVGRGGAFPVKDRECLLQGVEALLSDPAKLQQASQVCRKYVEENKGGTENIMASLKKFID